MSGNISLIVTNHPADVIVRCAAEAWFKLPELHRRLQREEGGKEKSKKHEHTLSKVNSRAESTQAAGTL